MKKPRIVLAFVFGFLIAFRTIAEDFENLTVIVAMINIIALYVVLYDVAEKLRAQILSKITSECASKHIASRERRNFTCWFYGLLISACALFIWLYFQFWCSSLGNDIISIAALAISILDTEIIVLGTYLYKV